MAVLPCHWIYWEVGKELQKGGSTQRDYQRWVDVPDVTVTEGSYLIGSCDGGGFDAVFSPSARECAETKMEGVSYAAFV